MASKKRVLTNPIEANEKKALALANDRAALRNRLYEERAMLCDELKRDFGNAGIYDYDNGTLTGNNGLRLVWLLRRSPQEPAGPNNQQTSTGFVGVIQLPQCSSCKDYVERETHQKTDGKCQNCYDELHNGKLFRAGPTTPDNFGRAYMVSRQRAKYHT